MTYPSLSGDWFEDILVLPWSTQHMSQCIYSPLSISLVQASSIRVEVDRERRQFDQLVNPLHAVLDERLDPILIGRYSFELFQGDAGCKGVLDISSV
jgi:hypothetical protein